MKVCSIGDIAWVYFQIWNFPFSVSLWNPLKKPSFRFTGKATAIVPSSTLNNYTEFYKELLNSIGNTCSAFQNVNKPASTQKVAGNAAIPTKAVEPVKDSIDLKPEILKQFKAIKPDNWVSQMPQLINSIEKLTAGERKDVSGFIVETITSDKDRKKK